MKALLIGINSKFIHPNVAIRLLKQNSKHDLSIKEYNIKDDIEKIIDYINQSDIDVIGLSVYIWNVEIIKQILHKIENKIVVLGGPEVSYECNKYFDLKIDFIIKGEGERAFDSLLDNLTGNYRDISNLSYKLNGQIFHNDILELDLTKIEFASKINFNVHQIQYLETSRGCPYKCSYCLASLEKKVRYFSLEKVKEEILFLINNGAKVFKFLDRTFNLNVENSLEIINFIITNHKENNSFQLEITGDILDGKIIDLINTAKTNLFRFEIGIQSTNEQTNLSVDRHQNTKELFTTIKEINKINKIDLHVDLIAGLPYENLNSFAKTFNDTFILKCKELQLGFLKLLPGTKLKKQAAKYGYIYDDKAPYEIIENNFLTKDDLTKIKIVEEVLEKYVNKNYLPRAIDYFVQDPFADLLSFGLYYQERYDWFNYQLDDLFKRLADYKNDSILTELLVYDYLKFHKFKPKRWWNNKLTKQEKNNVLRKFSQTNSDYNLNDLYKYATVEKVNQYLIAVYKPNNIKIYKYKI